MSDGVPKPSKNGERSSSKFNSISRTTSETLRVNDSDGATVVPVLVPPSQRQKKSSFQITSVVTATRMSNDGGEDSADDLDESHTEDISDVIDTSRVTDLENETPSYSEDTFSKDDVFFNPGTTSLGTAPVIPTSSQYGLALVPTNEVNAIIPSGTDINIAVTESGNVINIANVKNADNELGRETHVTRNERFKVVKIESTEPFKRGRWQCMDYLDHTMMQPSHAQAAPAASEGQQSFQGADSGIDTGHEESLENHVAHQPPPNIQAGLQNSVSPGQSLHNLQINLPKPAPVNPILNQNIAPQPQQQQQQQQQQQPPPQQQQQQPQQIMQQAPPQAQSMSHGTVPIQQSVPQPQSLQHQQIQQVLSQAQANFQQQAQNQSQASIQQIQPPQANMQQQLQMQQMQQHQQQMQQHQQHQQQMHQNASNSMPQSHQSQMNPSMPQFYQQNNQAPMQMLPNQQPLMQHMQTGTHQNMMNMIPQPIPQPIPQYQNLPMPNYNQQLVQQVPNQNASLGGYVMPAPNQLMQQGGQLMQQVLTGAPSTTQMLPQQNYQNFPQQPQAVGMNVSGTGSPSQPINYPSAVNASVAPTNQNQGMTYSSAPVPNQTMGYSQPGQVGTSQNTVISYNNTNMPQSQPMTYPSPGVSNVRTQQGQASVVSGSGQQGIPNQAVVNPIPNQLNVGMMLPMQQQQQQPPTQPAQPQQMVPDVGAMNLAVTVLDGVGLEPSQPAAMDLQGSVALLESLVEVTASGDQLVASDDTESLNTLARALALYEGLRGAGGHEAPRVVALAPPVLSRAPSPTPCSASGTSAVAIDNKIEQAMDLVKSHLMFAVREEVEVLKEKIAELMDRINQLEVENTILKAHASQETLTQLTSQAGQKTQQPPSNSAA